MRTRWHRLAAALLLGLSLLYAIPAATRAAPATSAASINLHITSTRAIRLAAGQLVSFSPNGRWVAISTKDALCIAAVRDLKTQHCAKFSASGPRGVDAANVRWSPDSSHLAFSENAFISIVNADIWVMDAATGKLADLTPDSASAANVFLLAPSSPTAGVTVNLDTNPAWSADGKTLFFTRTPATGGNFAGTFLMQIAASGGRPIRLATIDAKEPALAFFGGLWPAADGTTIYLTVAHAQLNDPRNGVYRIGTDGSGLRKITGAPSPALGFPILVGISPAADLGLVRYPGAGQNAFTPTPLSVQNIRTGALTPLVAKDATGAARQHGKAFTAAFSPDGTRLLYSWSDTGDPHQQRLIVRDLASGAGHTLASAGDNAIPVQQWTAGLVWTAGSTILAASNPTTGFALTIGA